MDCLLNTEVPGFGQPVFTFTDPPGQFPGEFSPGVGVFALAGLGVGSGWYIGEGGE